MNNNNILNLNGKPLNYIVTKNKEAIKLFSDTGSLIIYDTNDNNDNNSEYIDNYKELWVSNQFLAAGYGAKTRSEQNDLSYIAANYSANNLYLNNRIDFTYSYSYNLYNILNNSKVSKGSYSHAGDDISFNTFDFNGDNIKLKELYDKFKSIQLLYKFEISNITYEYKFINDRKRYINIDNVPVGSKLEEINITIKGNTRDSGGINDIFISLDNQINNSEYVLSLEDLVRNSNIPNKSNNSFTLTLTKTFNDNDDNYLYIIHNGVDNKIIKNIQINTLGGISGETVIKPIDSEIINNITELYPTYLIGNTTYYILQDININDNKRSDINNYTKNLINNNQVEIEINDNKQFISLLLNKEDNIRLINAEFYDKVTCKVYDIIDFILCKFNDPQYIEYLIKLDNISSDYKDKSNGYPLFLHIGNNNLYFNKGIIKFYFIESTSNNDDMIQIKNTNQYWISWDGLSDNIPPLGDPLEIDIPV